MQKPHLPQLSLSKVHWFLTASDILVWGTATIGSPLVAIYLTSKFGGDTLQYIGIATAIYYLVRGVVQLPLGLITDKISSDSDEIALLILGSILMGVPYLFYPLVTDAWQYYFMQVIIGIGASLNLNNWRKLFAKNIDTNKEGQTYGFYETVMSIFTAVFGFVGGYLSGINAEIFEIVIMAMGVLITMGGIVVAGIYTVNNRRSLK